MMANIDSSVLSFRRSSHAVAWFNRTLTAGAVYRDKFRSAGEDCCRCDRVAFSATGSQIAKKFMSQYSDRAWYRPSADSVGMPSRGLFASAEEYYSNPVSRADALHRPCVPHRPRGNRAAQHVRVRIVFEGGASSPRWARRCSAASPVLRRGRFRTPRRTSAGG
jgi:hypothetical protein